MTRGRQRAHCCMSCGTRTAGALPNPGCSSMYGGAIATRAQMLRPSAKTCLDLPLRGCLGVSDVARLGHGQRRPCHGVTVPAQKPLLRPCNSCTAVRSRGTPWPVSVRCSVAGRSQLCLLRLLQPSSDQVVCLLAWLPSCHCRTSEVCARAHMRDDSAPRRPITQNRSGSGWLPRCLPSAS